MRARSRRLLADLLLESVASLGICGVLWGVEVLRRRVVADA